MSNLTLGSGIYVLYFPKLDSPCYIGQSINIASRFNKHKNLLLLGKHTNSTLQEYYELNKVLPELLVLETTSDTSNLDSAEIAWIEKFLKYNISIANIAKGGIGGLRGDAHHNSKYSNDKYIEACKLIANSPTVELKYISRLTGIEYYTIRDIACGKSQIWLKSVIPEEYTKMLSINRSSKRYTDSTYVRILELLAAKELNMREISDTLCVSYAVVRSIACGKTHTYLKDSYPDLYNIAVTGRN